MLFARIAVVDRAADFARVDVEAVLPFLGETENRKIVKQFNNFEPDCTSLLYVERDDVVDDIVLYVFGQFLLFEPVFVQSGHEVGERP